MSEQISDPKKQQNHLATVPSKPLLNASFNNNSKDITVIKDIV
jgi:hypothetical protein